MPRLLILDQPTQAHYPSEQDNPAGVPVDDEDRIAVRRMFRLMKDFVEALAPDFQIIVCDHADLPDNWFEESVRYRWRTGVDEIPALIPADWLPELDAAGRNGGITGDDQATESQSD